MSTKNIINRLDQIRTRLNSDQAYTAQIALSDVVKLSYDRTYSSIVQDSFDDQEICSADDIKRSLRENIVTELGTDCENCVGADGDDLAYLDNQGVHYAYMNDVQTPISRSLVHSMIESVKASLREDRVDA